MDKVILTPELEQLLRQELTNLSIKYGVVFTILVILLCIVAWNWINKKVSGEVEKGINAHKEKLINSYAVQLETYRQFVIKYHEEYAELNRLILKAQGAISVQFLKSYPDFKYFTEQELTKYLKEKSASDYDVKRLTQLIKTPKDLQTEMQDFINKYNLWKARDLLTKSKNHYWRNALYFSKLVGKSFNAIWKDLDELLLLQEYPSGEAGRMSRDERREAIAKQKTIDTKIDKLIEQMKKEVSAGYIK